MLEKLLSLLLHAKAGAISGVFLLGATGALVSVSASNGVTTITVTDPSPSPSASARPSAGATRTARPTPSASGSPSSVLSPTSSTCADEGKVLATQVKRVNSAFQGFHTDLMKLRGQREKAAIEKADHLLKQVREAAVKAIHATATCKKHDDDDEDEDESHEATTATTSLNSDRENDEHADSDHGKAGTSPITFTSTDPKAIADQAIAAMQAGFDTAKNAAAATPKPSHTPEQKKTDAKKHDGKSSEHHD